MTSLTNKFKNALFIGGAFVGSVASASIAQAQNITITGIDGVTVTEAPDGRVISIKRPVTAPVPAVSPIRESAGREEEWKPRSLKPGEVADIHTKNPAHIVLTGVPADGSTPTAQPQQPQGSMAATESDVVKRAQARNSNKNGYIRADEPHQEFVNHHQVYGHWEPTGKKIKETVYLKRDPKNPNCAIPTTKEVAGMRWVDDLEPTPPEPVVINGKDGRDGRDGVDGKDGKDGIIQVQKVGLQITDVDLAQGASMVVGDYADKGWRFQNPGFGVGLAALIYSCPSVVLLPAAVLTHLPFRSNDSMKDENKYIEANISPHLKRNYPPEVTKAAVKSFQDLEKEEDKAVKDALKHGGNAAAVEAAKSFAPQYLAAMRDPIIGGAFTELDFGVVSERPELLFTIEGGTILTVNSTSSSTGQISQTYRRQSETLQGTGIDVPAAPSPEQPSGRRLLPQPKPCLGTDCQEEQRERDAARKRAAAQNAPQPQ